VRRRAAVMVAVMAVAAAMAAAGAPAAGAQVSQAPKPPPAGETARPAAAPLGGVAYEGEDRATVRLAEGAGVEEHANAGYRLRRGEAPGEWTVTVSLAPLASRAPYAAPAGGPLAGEALAAAARAAAADADTVYGAVSGILGWIVHHVSLAEPEPAADPSAAASTGGSAQEAAVAGKAAAPAPGSPPTAAAPVLAADAAEVARLAVAMLGAAGIEARKVAGVVVGPPRPGAPHGAHTWIEVRYPDRGWAFSDPLHHHHYVPASYLRLAPTATGEAGAPAAAAAVELVARDDRRAPIDVYPAGGPGVGARRNDPAQIAAALRVVVPGVVDAAAVLVAGDGSRQRKALLGGEGVFVGLAGGSYRLEVLVPGRPRLERRIEIAPRERSAVFLGGEAAAQRPLEGDGKPAAAAGPPAPRQGRPAPR
jgi:hypothetical protein